MYRDGKYLDHDAATYVTMFQCIQYSFVLYYVVLFCFVLFCFVSYDNALYCFVLFSSVVLFSFSSVRDISWSCFCHVMLSITAYNLLFLDLIVSISVVLLLLSHHLRSIPFQSSHYITISSYIIILPCHITISSHQHIIIQPSNHIVILSYIRTLFTSLIKSLDPTDLSSSSNVKRKLSKKEKINACSILIISLLRFYSREQYESQAQATYVQSDMFPVLFCFVLFCFVLFCFVLFCS
jgi:hypothetical protein